MTDLVFAATSWPSNADMIEDVHRLNYLKDEDIILDPTYGLGTWWKKWCPNNLIKHDIAFDGIDFRNLPYQDSHFDAAVFDPPYVALGKTENTVLTHEGAIDIYNRYGLNESPQTPSGIQELINDGLTEVSRVVKSRGFILVKCQDYIKSNNLWPGTHLTICHAIDNLGFKYFDRLEHISGKRPQRFKTQVHARRNLSTLLVFKNKNKK